jgi:hypothetical protein
VLRVTTKQREEDVALVAVEVCQERREAVPHRSTYVVRRHGVQQFGGGGSPQGLRVLPKGRG